jgi:glycosyltransferase involved in cell wall biosynthesis
MRGQGAPAMNMTCVIPAFENPELLSRCLTSVLAQDKPDLEIIVTDDSRTDAVRSLAADLARTHRGLQYMAGARSGNPVDNWNHGLSKAGGALCVLVHHDEYLSNPAYLRMAASALINPAVAAVVGRVRVAPPSRFALGEAIAMGLGRPRWLLPAINWIGPTAAFVFRAGHRFDPTLVQLVDVEFYRRVMLTGKLEVLGGPDVGSLGRHVAAITAGIDPRALAMAELKRLSSRSDRAMTPFEYAIARAWWTIRSW